MALFLQSSQFTHWSRDHVQKYKSEVYNGENEEFTSLVKQSMVKLHSLAKKFAFPENAPVAATAVEYLKRFYVRRVPLDYHPWYIAVACLLLATKSEEMFVKVEDLEKHAGVSAQIILEFELIVLEGIQFHLKIHHPYRALRGFLDQIKKSPGMKDLNDKKKIAFVNQEIKKQSFEYVDHTMFLDLLFFYTPPQIALACLVRSLRELNAKDASFPKDMENLFGIWKLEQFDRNADIERLKGTVEEIISVMFKSYSAFQSVIQNQEHLTALWGKWDKNHNLKNDPNSEEYKQLQLEREKEEDDRRLEKQRRKRKEFEAHQAELLGIGTEGSAMDIDLESSFSPHKRPQQQ